MKVEKMSERKTAKRRRKEKRRGETRKTQHRAEKCKTAREGISRVEGEKGGPGNRELRWGGTGYINVNI